MPWFTVVGAIAGILTVTTLVLGAVRWFIRVEVGSVRDELRPNGGSSFRDHVDRRLDSQDTKIDRIDRRVWRLEQRSERRRD